MGALDDVFQDFTSRPMSLNTRQAIGFGHTEMTAIVQVLRDIDYAGGISAEILPLPDSETAATQTIKSYKHLFEGRSNNVCSTIN